jgi:hypothetical protein
MKFNFKGTSRLRKIILVYRISLEVEATRSDVQAQQRAVEPLKKVKAVTMELELPTLENVS